MLFHLVQSKDRREIVQDFSKESYLYHKSNVLSHDLAKWLSYYLYFFFFSFLFLLSWTYYTEGSTGKCHVTSITSHDITMMGHMIGIGK